MHTGPLVMNCVESVVQQQEVRQPSNEIPRVVPLRLLVRMHMLEVIQHQHREQRELLRRNDLEKRLLPVDPQCCGNLGRQDDVLR